jgi:CheY-like chemotaxis protein
MSHGMGIVRSPVPEFRGVPLVRISTSTRGSRWTKMRQRTDSSSHVLTKGRTEKMPTMAATLLKNSPSSEAEALQLRFLVVDDNRYIRYSLRAMIEAVPGWRVCAEAGDGAEALLKVGEVRPSVVIMDLQMPTMNGLEAARHISRLSPNLPIIMCTMFNTPQLQMDATNAGIYAIVDKGANLQAELLKSVRTLIQGESSPNRD